MIYLDPGPDGNIGNSGVGETILAKSWREDSIGAM